MVVMCNFVLDCGCTFFFLSVISIKRVRRASRGFFSTKIGFEEDVDTRKIDTNVATNTGPLLALEFTLEADEAQMETLLNEKIK